MTLLHEHEFQIRAGRNQALFREVNEQVETLQPPLGGLPQIDFCCECADTGCATPMQMTQEEYAAVRSSSARFAVVPEHVFPEAEVVVARTDRFWTVEKVEAAAEVAAALDPRAAPDAAG